MLNTISSDDRQGKTPCCLYYCNICLLHTHSHTYKLGEPDTQDTAGEPRTNSSVMYSYGPPHMAKQSRTTSSNIHTAAT